MSITKTMDIMAQEMFGEFGFSTCTDEERDVIVNSLLLEQKKSLKNNKDGLL